MNHRKYSNFLLIFFLIIIVLFRYEKYVIQGDFLITSTAPCSNSESCFVMDCAAADNPECEARPYKKIVISASIAPQCVFEHTCQNFVCSVNDSRCKIEYCSQEKLIGGEKCQTATSTENI